MTGCSGNSLVTGAFLAIATVAVGLLCFRRDIVLLPADYVFLALVLCFLLSSAFNGWTSNTKEYELIVLSLAAYPAGRFISGADIAAGRSAFIWATGIIVALGTVVTAAALWQQWMTSTESRTYSGSTRLESISSVRCVFSSSRW